MIDGRVNPRDLRGDVYPELPSDEDVIAADSGRVNGIHIEPIERDESALFVERRDNTPRQPFINGQNLRYFDRETGWRISSDQDGTTLTCTNPAELEYFGLYRHQIREMRRQCPAARALFDCGKTTEGYQIMRVPTLARANAFAAEKLAGLPTAGIRAFQTEDVGSTDVVEYLRYLSDENDPHLPVAYGHERHLHDLVGHWLGASAIDEKSMEVFKALSKDAISLWAKGPQWPNRYYVEALATAFDKFSDNQLRRTMRSYVNSRDGYLLSQSLDWISLRSHEHLPRAISIIRDSGMEVEPASGLKPILVPWEVHNLPSYYDQIAERFRT